MKQSLKEHVFDILRKLFNRTTRCGWESPIYERYVWKKVLIFLVTPAVYISHGLKIVVTCVGAEDLSQQLGRQTKTV